MKRIVSYVFILIFATVILFGCGVVENGSKESFKGMKKTSFKNVGFYIYKDWKEGDEAGDEKSSFMYYYPSNGMLMINIQKNQLDLKEETNWQEVMDGVKSGGVENFIQRSLKKASLNGYNGFEAVYSGNVSDTDTTNEMLAFSTEDGQLIIFSMTSFDKQENLYHKEFKKILSSIQIDVEETYDEYDDVEVPTQPDVPEEYLSALERADSYANNQYMSKKSLYKQLTSDYGEGFSKKAAKYAVKHVKTNWKKNALHKATDYANDQYMSKQGVYEQLTSAYGEQFTAKQANYAIKHVKANWKKNALQKAKDYSEDMNMSRQEVYEQLCSQYGEKFTAQEAQYAINHLK